MAVLISTNPGSGYKRVGDVSISSEKDVVEAVSRSTDMKDTWKNTSVKERIEILRPLRELFIKRRDDFVNLIHEEIGKSRKESEQEFDTFFLGSFDAFLENGVDWLTDEITFEDDTQRNRVIFEPFGVAAVILPWNYPLETFCWGVIPNLIAGNTVVMKHSEECPLVGKLIEEVFSRAALPDGVFNEIYGAGDVGAMLLDQDIDLIWFTGSSGVGKRVYEKAGKKFIKAILELGGSNPGIVFPDVDIELCAQEVFTQRFSNNGQSCNALKRLIVHEDVLTELTERLVAIAKTKIVGDSEDADYGSLVAKRQLDLLTKQVEDSLDKGAKTFVGGKVPDDSVGAYYLPTILGGVSKDMRVWREEVFGPVLPIVPFSKEEEAIALANDTEYGLGAYIFTEDSALFNRIAAQLEAGNIVMNEACLSSSCPFGGYKASGMGREHGRIGFRELCQVKVIAERKG